MKRFEASRHQMGWCLRAGDQKLNGSGVGFEGWIVLVWLMDVDVMKRRWFELDIGKSTMYSWTLFGRFVGVDR